MKRLNIGFSSVLVAGIIFGAFTLLVKSPLNIEVFSDSEGLLPEAFNGFLEVFIILMIMLIASGLLLALIHFVNKERGKNHVGKLTSGSWNTDERCEYCGKWTNDDYKLCDCDKEVLKDQEEI